MKPGRQRGIFLGVAYGDAWGYPNERKSYADLLADGPQGPEMPERLIVSDDTQMTLYLADALRSEHDLRHTILDGWLAWLHDPDRRGWGEATITALKALDQGMPWQKASVDSNGCGAVMRVAACAFLPEDLWAPVSVWQAATTHSGLAAMASALVATSVVRAPEAGGLLQQAVAATHDQRLLESGAAWIIEHPRAGSLDDAVELLRTGMKMLRVGLERTLEHLPMFRADPWCADPSDPRYGGRGFVAQQCLSCALLCADTLHDSPVQALRRAATTGGDSDSIAAVTGMVLGAAHGDVWPTEWLPRLEPRIRDWIESYG
ncbi:MAG: ADP-ribosylglycohydrolase family protein [Candidatus Nanopelagicales bacterium]